MNRGVFPFLFILLLAATLSASGCLQNGATGGGGSSTGGALSLSTGSGGGGSGGGGLSGGSVPSGTSSTAITLINAYRSNLDPGGVLDLVGLSDEIGTYCPTTGACQCRINWTDSGTPFQVDAPPVYVETNLMRCSYGVAAGSGASFRINIVVNAGSLSSNAMTIAAAYQNPQADHTQATNFRKVYRYQCRDIVHTNTDFYGGTLLDPQVWNLSYTFNLFTTSLGADYGFTSPGWDCPLTPTTLLPAPYISSDLIYDMNLYSVSPLNGDSTIYPVNDSAGEALGANRHDFSLAAFHDGIFRQPVCLPHTLTDGNNSLAGGALDCSFDTSQNPPRVGRDVLGWAAVPDSIESCPSSGYALPPKKKWAKLWQLRASLPARSVINVINSNQIGELYCTTTDHEWTGSALTLNGDRYAQGALFNFNVGAVGMASVNGKYYGNCNGASCAATDGSARFNMREGYGNTVGASCAANTRDAWCATPNTGPGFEWASAYPASATSGAPGVRHIGGPSAGLGALFDPTGIDGFIAVPSDAPQGSGGQVCNPTMPGDRWSQGFAGAKDAWLVGSGGGGACIEADTSSSGALFNDKSDGFIANAASAPLAHPIKNWFDFLGVTCPGSGDCSSLPSLPLARSNRSPASSWGGYGVFNFGIKAIDGASSGDMMYVVTPTSVTRAQMGNPIDPTFMQYQPYRYINGAPIYYYTESGALNTTDPAQRLPVYPLCVLQDTP